MKTINDYILEKKSFEEDLMINEEEKYKNAFKDLSIDKTEKILNGTFWGKIQDKLDDTLNKYFNSAVDGDGSYIDSDKKKFFVLRNDVRKASDGLLFALRNLWEAVENGNQDAYYENFVWLVDQLKVKK